MGFGWEIESMKNNPKAKFWKLTPNQKHTVNILPKEGHQLLHDYFITNHKTGNENKNLGEEIRQVVDYKNDLFGYTKEEMAQIEPMPRFGDYANELGGNWEIHDDTIRRTIPRINWEQIINKENWEEWHFEGYKLFHPTEFKRWSLHHDFDIIGHMPYDIPIEKAFAWAEEHIFSRDIHNVKTIKESGGNPNIMAEKELPINVTLERAKIVNEWVPKEINDYRRLANRCSDLWNCDLSTKDAEQLIEEVFIRLKEERIKPNFFKHRS